MSWVDETDRVISRGKLNVPYQQFNSWWIQFPEDDEPTRIDGDGYYHLSAYDLKKPEIARAQVDAGIAVPGTVFFASNRKAYMMVCHEDNPAWVDCLPNNIPAEMVRSSVESGWYSVGDDLQGADGYVYVLDYSSREDVFRWKYKPGVQMEMPFEWEEVQEG